ncbi:hypothetical protein HDV64DRAFT_242263 [Trichoderma sp. TUCIM 5745]
MTSIPFHHLRLKAQSLRALRSIHVCNKHTNGLYQRPTRLKHRTSAILAACLSNQISTFSRSFMSSSSHKEAKSTPKDWDDLSAARRIQWILNSGDNAWGWVIYRCTYKSELQGSWEEFKILVENRIQRAVADSDAPDITEKLSLIWVEDPQLEGAPLDELKRRFRAWVSTDMQDPSFMYTNGTSLRGSRHSYFFQVDEESLVSCLHEAGVDLHEGHINMVSGWTDGLAPEEATDEFGYALDAEDWMKIPASEITPGTYMEFDHYEMWYLNYTQPPDVCYPRW